MEEHTPQKSKTSLSSHGDAGSQSAMDEEKLEAYTRNTQTESGKGLGEDGHPRLRKTQPTLLSELSTEQKQVKEQIQTNIDFTTTEELQSANKVDTNETKLSSEVCVTANEGKKYEFLQILGTAGLNDCYPQKMKKGDVFIIDSLLDNEPKREKGKGLHYIHRLMMLDCNARDIATKSTDEFDKAQCTNIQSSHDFLTYDSESTDEDSAPNKHTHPMDIHIAVFLCADDFLRQYICTKLALCQFALPLLVPDPCTGEVEFPLWALRQIKKSWKSFPKSGEEALELNDSSPKSGEEALELNDSSPKSGEEALELNDSSPKSGEEALELNDSSPKSGEEALELNDSSPKSGEEALELNDSSPKSGEEALELNDSSPKSGEEALELNDSSPKSGEEALELNDSPPKSGEEALELNDSSPKSGEEALELNDSSPKSGEEALELNDSSPKSGEEALELNDSPPKSGEEALELNDSSPKSGEEALELDNQLLCSASFPVVSFIRLGSSSHSKSQILNNVISKQKHDVFFHRHCRGSTTDCLFMDGVVEVSWYLPGGWKDDIFDRCVAFMNLHGDAIRHPRQLQFLQEVSTVNMVLFSEKPLDEAAERVFKALFDSSVPLICLFSGKERISPGPNKTKVRLAVKNKNEALLSDEITHHIKHCVDSHEKTMSLEACLSAAKSQQFKVDEDKEPCHKGRDQAQKLVDLIEMEKKGTNPRQTCFPLQGEIWKEWCTLDKKEHRLDSKTCEYMEKKLCVIKAKKQQKRQEQFKLSSAPNDLMRSFINYLDSSTYSVETHLYMQQWLRVYLDGNNSKSQKNIVQQFHKTWMNKRETGLQNERSEQIEQDLQTLLQFLTIHLKEETFEFHDFMREAAQMYEAGQASSVNEKSRWAEPLPSIAAEMLISGCTLELMNGETGHVPLVWISSVLDELTAKLGDRKVFVLSVLGLQSSGKSTLLNTMFGLQFAVSAGRCTRGAFMQLLTVGEEMREQLQYDLVLVVDTEGLRSPELIDSNMVRHDNELATFVIGISDMTLINIMGECPVEMQDILQICVQAFLRMKQVRITPSLIFVHQNVADISAGDKNMEAKRCMLKRLDDMACVAAKEEHVEVRGFNDIIQFDVDTQVFYFKSLLQGDPPMAPPNPSYSQNVQELKAQLFSKFHQNQRFSTLSGFKFQVQDIWHAMLAENFVFSFTNTLDASVNKALEEQYVRWAWMMRKNAPEIQNKLIKQIKHDRVQSVDALNVYQALDPIYTDITTDMENYFKNGKNTDILAQYKQSTKNRFENLKFDITGEIKCHCIDFISLTESHLKLDMKKREYESKLLKMNKSLAGDLKGKDLSDEKRKTEFDILWQKLMKEIPTDTTSRKNVMVTVQNILLDNFKHVPNIADRIKSGTKIFKFNESEHICKRWGQVMSESLMLSSGVCLEEDVNRVTQNIQEDVQKYIKGKEEKKMDFSVHFVQEILGKIKDHIAEARKTLTQITENYTADLSISLCKLAAERFQKMHEDFKKANDPVSILQSQREEYRQLFEKFCQGATSTTFCAEFLCTKLKPAVQQALLEKAIVQLIDLLKVDCSAFKGTKSNMEKHMMKDLAEKENFDSFMEYLNSPRTFLQKYIEETAAVYFKQNDSKKLFVSNLQSLKNTIMEKFRTINLETGSFSLWLDTFCEEVKTDVEVSRHDFQNIEKEDIGDANFFNNALKKSLDKMFQTLLIELERNNPIDISNYSSNPVHEGDHCAQFHRPQALGTWAYSATNWLERIRKGKEMICSFKESAEMRMHKNLEDRFSIWTWQLRKHALQVQTELQNQTVNCDKTSHKHDMKFQEAKIDVTKEIQEYIKKENASYVRETWKKEFKRRYKKEKKKLRCETQQLCKAQKKNKSCTKSQNEALLFQKMKNASFSLKVSKPSDEIVVKEFDHLWSEWLIGISSHGNTVEHIDVNAEVNRILQKTFSKDPDVTKKLTHENLFDFGEKYVTMKPYFLFFKHPFSSIEQDVRQLLRNIENSVIKRTERQEDDGVDSVAKFISHTLYEVKSKLHKFQQEKAILFFSEDMITDFSVYVCRLIVPQLTEFHQSFIDCRNPALFFERRRGEYLQAFKNLCQGAASTAFADVLCSKLKAAVQKAVYGKASIQIADEIMTQFQASGRSMEDALLKAFQHPGDHDSLTENIKESIQLYINMCFKKNSTTNNNMVKNLSENLDDIQEDIHIKYETTIRTVKSKRGNISMWLDRFCRSISPALEFPRSNLKCIDNIVGGGVEAIEDSVEKALSDMWKDLKKEVTEPIHTEMLEKTASQILTLHLKERWEQCKLCKESLFEADSAVGAPLRFSVNFCTTVVSSKETFIPGNGLTKRIPCSRYREAGMPYSNWKISPTQDNSLYWKWFICRFKNELERKYNKRFEGKGSIPKEWTQITKQMVLNEL